jgi:hypothetical protein
MYFWVVCADSWPARDWMAIMGAPRAPSAEHAECRITWSLAPFFFGIPARAAAASLHA